MIESPFVCSERHRAFFRQTLWRGFSFNVPFQQWLKANAGRTYRDAISAYGQLLAEKKSHPVEISRQFEYNAYIRAFFADNAGHSLSEAIRCWNYKKQLSGSHAYARSDLAVLEQP